MPKLIDGSKFTTIGVTPGTGATTLYTVPANHASVVRHLSISNNNAAAKKITAQFMNFSGHRAEETSRLKIDNFIRRFDT